MGTVLERIVESKRREVEAAKRACPLEALIQRLPNAPPPKDFLAALSGFPTIRLIAEVKKASPSKGIIRHDFDPVRIAQEYARGGAACLSVLTDEPFFQGSLDYLIAIRQVVLLPLLRKDFIIDEYQLWEARVAGADAVLLIAECLEEGILDALYRKTRELGMHALIELYEPENLPKVLATGTPLIGINNRNLHTFEVDLEHTIRLRDRIPDSVCVVGESGIATAHDAARLFEAGIQAILVGESLMRQPDVGDAVRRLLGVEPA